MILREIIAHFGVQTDGEKAIQAISSAMDLAKGHTEALIGAFGRLAGSLVAAGATVAFVDHQAQLADQIGDTSERLGISSDALQAWQHAAQMSGSSAEEMTSSLDRLQMSMASVGEGGKEQAQALRRLGVDYRNADGTIRPMQDILLGIAEGMERTTDPTERAALATRLFGRQGARLIPLLSRGRAGVAALTEEFQALGGGASAEAIAAAGEYNDNIDRLRVSLFSLAQRISNFFLPAFVRVTDMMVSAARGLASMAAGTRIMEVVIVSLVTAIAGVAMSSAASIIAAFSPVILTTLAIAAALAVLFVGAEDVFQLFTGGQSLLGAFLDELFGVGTAAQFVATTVDTLGAAWVSVRNAIDMAIEAARGGMRILMALQGTADDVFNERSLGERLQNALGENQRAHEDAQAVRDVRSLTAGIDQRVVAHQREQEGIAQFGMAFATDTGVPRSDAPPAGRTEPAPTRTVTLPPSGRGDTTITNAPHIETHLSVTVPPGTPRDAAEAVRGAIREEMDVRDARAIAALQRQAVER